MLSNENNVSFLLALSVPLPNCKGKYNPFFRKYKIKQRIFSQTSLFRVYSLWIKINKNISNNEFVLQI